MSDVVVITKKKKKNTLAKVWRERFNYILILPSFIATAVFCYWPMYGVLLAFKNYNMDKGIIGSPWANNYGFEHFIFLFRDQEVLGVFKNTLIIALTKMIFYPVLIILVALLLNELRNQIYKRVVQSVLYLPHFLSWVIIAGVLYNIFSITTGVFNKIVMDAGGQAIEILDNPDYIRPLIYISGFWKEAGFATIIYLAAISGVNPELYESALIDGANRLRQAWSITLPSIRSTIIILLIMSTSGILNAGGDQILNLIAPKTRASINILDTYMYYTGVIGSQFEIASALSLFKTCVSLILFIVVNQTAKILGQETVF